MTGTKRTKAPRFREAPWRSEEVEKQCKNSRRVFLQCQSRVACDSISAQWLSRKKMLGKMIDSDQYCFPRQEYSSDIEKMQCLCPAVPTRTAGFLLAS